MNLNLPSRIAEALDAVRSRGPETLRKALEDLRGGGNCGLRWTSPEHPPVIHDPTDLSTPCYYLGDIHGDFLALYTLLEWIFDTENTAEVIFLGDLLDRGPFSYECLLLFLDHAMAKPGRITWIAGNHDLGLSRDESSGIYMADTEPSEFVEWLNTSTEVDGDIRTIVGEFIMLLTPRLPRALLRGDGLLVTHGGFPLGDLHESLEGAENLVSPPCLQDFTWTRASRHRRKIPNRTHRGCSFGYENFEEFCRRVIDFFPVKRMLRGHDHVAEGLDRHKTYLVNPVITFNAFGFDPILGYAEGDSYRETLLLGKHISNELPEIIAVPVLPVVENFPQDFPEPMTPLF